MHPTTTLAHKYKPPGIFYIDLWPFGLDQLVIADPAFAHEYLTFRKLPKHPEVAAYLDPFFGAGNIVTANGELWKKLRDMLAPPFLSAHTFLATSLVSPAA